MKGEFLHTFKGEKYIGREEAPWKASYTWKGVEDSLGNSVVHGNTYRTTCTLR